MDYSNILPLIIGLVLAWVLTRFNVTRKLTQYVSTLFHEAGHAISALIFGGQVQSITLQKDGSGLTTSGHVKDSKYLFVRVIVLLSGYSFPINVGFTALALTFLQVDSLYILIFFGVVGVLTLVFIRNLMGFLIVFGYISLVGLAVLLQDYISLQYSMGLVASILFVNGIKDAVGITKFNFSKEQKYGSTSNDFTYLKEATLINHRVWNVFYLLGQVIILPIIVYVVVSLTTYFTENPLIF